MFAIFIARSTRNVLSMTAMMKLDGTNYHKWKKSLVMNLTFLKLDLALEIYPPEKPTDDSNVVVKKLYGIRCKTREIPISRIRAKW